MFNNNFSNTHPITKFICVHFLLTRYLHFLARPKILCIFDRY